MQGGGDVGDRGEGEVVDYRCAKGCSWASAVLRPRRVPQRRRAYVDAAAPVPRDPAQRGEAGGAAVGGHADAVDAGAADHADAPGAAGPGAQDGVGVVVDALPHRPTAGADGLAQRLDLVRQIGPGEEGRDAVHLDVGRHARRRHRLGAQRGEYVHRRVDAHRLRAESAAPRAAQNRAVRPQHRNIRFGVAAVDSEQQARLHQAHHRCSRLAATSFAASSSATLT